MPTFPGPPLNFDFPQAIMLDRGVAVAVMAQPPTGSFDKTAQSVFAGEFYRRSQGEVRIKLPSS